MEQVLVISSVALWLVVSVNLLLTIALIRRLNQFNQKGSDPFDDGLKVGEKAPDFTATTLQGELVDLKTYAGRSVAFIFVSPQCRPCREELPRYETLFPKARSAGVELVLVSNEDDQLTRAFAEEFAIRLPVLAAPHQSNPFTKDYKINGTPSFCLVDPAGVVQAGGFPSEKFGRWKELAEAWERGARRDVGRLSERARGDEGRA